jgi:hypothetical protein
MVDRTIGKKLDGSPLADPDAGKNHAVAMGTLGGAKGEQQRFLPPRGRQSPLA